MVYKVLAVSGSLQKASTNTGLLRACLQIKNPDLQIEILDISQFPHLNMDLVVDGKFPHPVQQARHKVLHSDAVLFAVPQYNFSMSAPLINAYDWLSAVPAPNIASPLKQKVVGIISSGLFGGNQAQQHFAQIGKYCKIKLMTTPKIQIKRFEPGNFNQKGDLINEHAKVDLSNYLKDFAKFIGKNK